MKGITTLCPMQFCVAFAYLSSYSLLLLNIAVNYDVILMTAYTFNFHWVSD